MRNLPRCSPELAMEYPAGRWAWSVVGCVASAHAARSCDAGTFASPGSGSQEDHGAVRQPETGERLDGSTGSGHYATDYVQRARIAYIGVGGNLPAVAFYPIAQFDRNGKALNGAHHFFVHVTKADIPPIDPKGFWSLTMYDSEYFLVANPINRYSLSSRDNFKHNQDSSMDLYMPKDPPGGDQQSNWLPAPDGDFILMLRLYWPKDEAVNGAWVPLPARRLDYGNEDFRSQGTVMSAPPAR
jgi:hypothetical protein